MSNAPIHFMRRFSFATRHLIEAARQSGPKEQNRASRVRCAPRLELSRMESLLEPTSELAWVLAAQGYDPLREAIYESRFSISNGLLGLRAGRPVSRGERWGGAQRASAPGRPPRSPPRRSDFTSHDTGYAPGCIVYRMPLDRA